MEKALKSLFLFAKKNSCNPNNCIVSISNSINTKNKNSTKVLVKFFSIFSQVSLLIKKGIKKY